VVTDKCTKVIGPALNAERKLPNYLSSQMETGLFSAVIVTDKKEIAADRDSNRDSNKEILLIINIIKYISYNQRKPPQKAVFVILA